MTVPSYNRAADLIPVRRSQSEDHTNPLLSSSWDHGPYRNQALASSRAYDFVDMSPDLPNPVSLSNTKYALPFQETNLDKTLTPSFIPKDFDDLMYGLDGPTKSLHSLATEIEPTEFPAARFASPGPSIDFPILSNEHGDSFPLQGFTNAASLSKGPQSLQEINGRYPRENLYSTPLSWERPRLDFQDPEPFTFSSLSPDEESRLLAIAMPRLPPPISPLFSPSPEPEDTHKSLKRKSSSSPDSTCSASPRIRNPSPQKEAHKLVEKRYRTNLIHKIDALRDCIPALRVIDKRNSCSEDSQQEVQGSLSTQKLNKAAVLSKAVEYIKQLEKHNEKLSKESRILTARINAFEILLGAQSTLEPAPHVAAASRQACKGQGS